MRRKCFATDGHRRLSVLEDAFFAPVPLATDGGLAAGGSGVYPLQASMLLPD